MLLLSGINVCVMVYKFNSQREKEFTKLRNEVTSRVAVIEKFVSDNKIFKENPEYQGLIKTFGTASERFNDNQDAAIGLLKETKGKIEAFENSLGQMAKLNLNIAYRKFEDSKQLQ